MSVLGLICRCPMVWRCFGTLALLYAGISSSAVWAFTPQEYAAGMRLKADVEAQALAQKQARRLISSASALAGMMRKQAANEAATLPQRERIERDREELKLQDQIRGWATGRFRPPEQRPARTSLHESWKRARDLSEDRLLNFPEQAGGAISTGNGLNFFLNACGPSAVEHVGFSRQAQSQMGQLISEQQQLNRDLGRSPNDPPDPNDPETQQIVKEIEVLKGRLALLKGLGGSQPLTPYDRQHIRCKMGETGFKLIIDLNEEPLPLKWPPVLRRDDFAVLRSEVERARQAALEELKAGKGLSPAASQQLTEAVDDLHDDFLKSHMGNLDRVRGGAAATGEVQRYMAGKKFLQELRYSVVRFLEANELQDVYVRPFEGESIPELMAFMVENGLRFAPAEANDERTYRKTFDLMSEYYRDLYSMQLASVGDHRHLEMLEAHERQLRTIMTENTEVDVLQLLEGTAKVSIGDFLMDAKTPAGQRAP